MYHFGKRLIHPLKPLFQTTADSSRLCQALPVNFRKVLVVSYSIAIKNDVNKRELQVNWDDGTTSRFPHIYLRDNCQCPDCFHSSAKQRLITDSNVFDAYDVNTTASTAKLNSELQQIEIKWDNDQHISIFDADWLKRRRFPTSQDQVGKKCCYSDRRLWASDLNDNIPTVEFNEIISNDMALYWWLQDLATIGITLVKNVPQEVGQVERVANRVAYPRVTNYGRTFTVKSKLNPSNVAYTDKDLPLHTDLPYFQLVPGIQLLHCIRQTSGEGGKNQFVDGFHVANVLKKENPYYYDLLTTHAFIYSDVGNDYVEYNQLNHHPVITLNKHGKVTRFAYNSPARSSLLDVPEDKVTDIYLAFHKILKIMYDPANLVTRKMDSGDMVVFDNCRVLHGRSGFKVTSEGDRHLEGCYIDWDETASRMRAIEEKHGLKYFTGVI